MAEPKPIRVRLVTEQTGAKEAGEAIEKTAAAAKKAVSEINEVGKTSEELQKLRKEAADATAAISQMAAAATKASLGYQDAQGRWKTATGDFVTSAQQAANSVQQIGNKAPAINTVTKALNQADIAASDFVTSLRAGIGIDLGGRIVSGIGRIPEVLREATERGIQFNVTLENTATAVAAIIEKFQGVSRAEALQQATLAVEELKRQAVAAPGTIQQLAEAWIASAGAASAANIPINQQIDLMVRLSQAVSRLALPQQQLVQETRALLTGNITLDAALAKTLGITNESIRKAKEQGDLYGYLVGQIGALGEASDTLEVRWSNFNDALDETLGLITKPIFDELRDAVQGLTEAVSDPKTVRELKALGYEIAALVRSGAGLTEWAIKNAPALALVAKTAGVLAVALAGIKIIHILAGMTQWVLALGNSARALDVETAALGRNTTAQGTNAAARALAESSANSATVLRRKQKHITAANNTVSAGAAFMGTDGVNRRGAVAAAGAGSAVSAIARGTILTFVAMMVKESLESYMESDIAARTDTANTQLRTYSNFAKQAQTISTEDERKSLMESIDQAITDARFANDPTYRGLEQLWNIVKEKDLTTPAANAEQKAKEEEARIKREETLVKNREAQDSIVRRNIETARDKTATDAIEKAREALDPSLLDAPIAEVSKKLTNATQRASDLTQDPVQYAEALADQEQYKEILAAYREERLEIEKEAGEEAKKKQKEATKERIDALQDEIALVEAQGQQRLAELDRIKVKEKDNGKDRVKIEDEIAAQRLALENQIGALQEESATKRQARELTAEAARVNRQTALTKSKGDDKDPEEQLRDLGAGKIDARRRRSLADRGRGGIDPLDLGASRLDEWDANFSDRFNRVAGAVRPSALPGAGAMPETQTAGADSKGGGANPVNELKGGVASLTDALAPLSDVASEIKAAAQSTETAANEMRSGAASLNGRIKKLEAAVALLQRG